MPTASSSDDVSVHFTHPGGDGPPLLLAHATGFCADVWRPVAAALAGDFDCWALDFRGHGRSDVPASGSFDWEGTADDVLAVIDAARASDGVAGPWVGAVDGSASTRCKIGAGAITTGGHRNTCDAAESPAPREGRGAA